jgi:putative hydrolase of the HAD superfamily
MIKVIAIDLDDTLLDTSGLLAPKATLDAFSFLIRNGLQLSPEQCEERRLELIKSISHREVFEILARQYGSHKTLEILPEVINIFYDPAIPELLPLMDGAKENIDYLKNKYSLYLVTAGAETAQRKKAQALGIAQDFKKIFVVNSLLKKRKKEAFLKIINDEQIKPEELLCIGNSISSEITDALAIGAMACYFEFGEDRGDITKLPLQPHYRIKNHKELIKACQL